MSDDKELGGSIARAVHDANNPYIMVKRTSVEDPNVPCDALGVWLYVLSKPDTWEVAFWEICKRFSIRRTKLRRIMDDLLKAGYLARNCTRSEDGRFNYQWLFFESKLPDEEREAEITKRLKEREVFSRSNSHEESGGRFSATGSPASGSPASGKPTTLVSNESSNNESCMQDTPPHQDKTFSNVDTEWHQVGFQVGRTSPNQFLMDCRFYEKWQEAGYTPADVRKVAAGQQAQGKTINLAFVDAILSGEIAAKTAEEEAKAAAKAKSETEHEKTQRILEEEKEAATKKATPEQIAAIKAQASLPWMKEGSA